jgi:hypothetical protein
VTRIKARELVKDRNAAECFDLTDPIKDWDYCVEKYKKERFARDALWNVIIESSTRSRKKTLTRHLVCRILTPYSNMTITIIKSNKKENRCVYLLEGIDSIQYAKKVIDILNNKFNAVFVDKKEVVYALFVNFAIQEKRISLVISNIFDDSIFQIYLLLDKEDCSKENEQWLEGLVKSVVDELNNSPYPEDLKSDSNNITPEGQYPPIGREL